MTGKPEESDHISTGECAGYLAGEWVVWRRDDNVNEFILEAELAYEDAKSLASKLEGKPYPRRAGPFPPHKSNRDEGSA